MELETDGISILNNVYSKAEISAIIDVLESAKHNEHSFLKSKDLFAIRQLLKHVPKLKPLLFNDKVLKLLAAVGTDDYFLSKSIYFDKPKTSNWFVAYHQDLSISVDQKADISGFKNWTFKKETWGVQPPIKILKDTITLRIHLDATTSANGALRIIPKSHLNGIIRKEGTAYNLDNTKAYICNVKAGGVMLMKPLTMHASNRTTNNKQRRVIHLEFNPHKLPDPISWLEYLEIK